MNQTNQTSQTNQKSQVNKGMDNGAIEIVNKIANQHCHRTFGYFTEADLRQEIWLICLDKIDTFDPTSGKPNLTYEEKLEHYLRSIVSKRLVNKFKKVTKTVKKPCEACPYKKDLQERGCERHHGNDICAERWERYRISTESRNSLLACLEESRERESKHNFLDAMANREWIESIRDMVDEDLRFDLDEILGGRHISKHRLDKLSKNIREILEDADSQAPSEREEEGLY